MKIRGNTSNITMTPRKTNRGVTFIAKSSKDLDELYTLSRKEIYTRLFLYLKRKFKNIKFIVDDDYSGAGYAFKIDLDNLVDKIQ